MSPAHGLDGRTAVITGGAGLLGVEHAVALSNAGADVALLDVDLDRLASAVEGIRERVGRGRVDPVFADVTDARSLTRVLAELVGRGQAPTILVNNAAVNPSVTAYGATTDGSSSAFESMSVDRWNREIDVGLTGAFLCCQVFGSDMAARGGGVIVNIASDLAVIAPDQRIYSDDDDHIDKTRAKPVTYSVVKSGLLGLTRYLSTYWADEGVRVNALSPGGVLTDQPPDFVARLTRRIPMARMAARDEYHGALVFLCSDASAYMTGQNLVVDGGRTAW